MDSSLNRSFSEYKNTWGTTEAGSWNRLVTDQSDWSLVIYFGHLPFEFAGRLLMYVGVPLCACRWAVSGIACMQVLKRG